MSRWLRLRATLVGASTAALAASSALGLTVLPASATTGAQSTTVNVSVDGSPHCFNGDGVPNCNLYDGKQYVWFSGLPAGASLGAGTYIWAVLSPGGQPNANDFAPLRTNGNDPNLSDETDPSINREFSTDGTTITNLGSHESYGSLIRVGLNPPSSPPEGAGVAWYADTPNPGGVYILAVCQISSSQSTSAITPGTVDPHLCKYDAFKVQAPTPPCTENCGPGQVFGSFVVTKDANGAYSNTYKWTATKAVDKTLVKQIGGSTIFTYTVTASYDGGTISNIKVTGTISVFNGTTAADGVTLEAVNIDSVTDQLSDGTACTVTGGGAKTLAGGSNTDFAYVCNLSALPQGTLDNTATVAWSQQTLVSGDTLFAGTADFTFNGVSFAATNIDSCATVKDTFNGGVADTLGTVCVGDSPAATNVNLSGLGGFSESFSAPTFTFIYSRTIAIQNDICVAYSNQAGVSGNTTTTTSSVVTVTVCGGVTGGLTMGFWQNKNGQGLITTGRSTGGICDSGTYLRTFHPFSNLSPTASCSVVATYVYNVVKAATCGGITCNAMLKAQMLATALDVFFSDPANGDTIRNFNGGNPVSLGGVKVDLTQIFCDASTGGSCVSSYQDTSSAFGGGTCQTVSALLAYQNTADPAIDAGTNWYLQAKATQVLAKNTFDAINNQIAFSCL